VRTVDAASLLENVRFNALVIVPNAVQGVFRRRRRPVAAATAANIDGHAIGLLRGMRDGHDGGPVWVRVIREPALLLLHPDQVRRVLEGAPEPFASGPKAKRDGMAAFQPDALTVSRGDAWRNRRAFNERVIDAAFAGSADGFRGIAAEEISALAAEGEIDWESWSAAFQRIARRVVLGPAARDDTELSKTLAEMMSEANGMPGKPSAQLSAFTARLGEYVQDAAPASLVGRIAGAPADAETKQVGQVAHWLFATGDTLAINAFRALALLASHPDQRARALTDDDYLAGCLEEAMRLWPTTSMLAREAVTDTEWDGETVPAGTQVLIPNTFFHRDTSRHEWADDFAPERWTSGEATDDWSFNHFSRGPQGCPGQALAMLLGTAALRAVIDAGEPELEAPKLDPAKPLPRMFDFFGIRVAVRSN
jgi:cytochrome P450